MKNRTTINCQLPQGNGFDAADMETKLEVCVLDI